MNRGPTPARGIGPRQFSVRDEAAAQTSKKLSR